MNGQCDGVAYLSYRNVHLPFANLIRIKRSVLGAYPFANLIRFRVAFWEHTRILHINPMVVCLSMYAAHSEIRTQIKKKLIYTYQVYKNSGRSSRGITPETPINSSGQESFEVSRFGSGQKVVGSGPKVFHVFTDMVRSSFADPTRPASFGPTREQP